MKVSQKDMPKVMLLVILIGGCLVFIGATVLNRKPETAEKKAPPNLLLGNPTQVAAIEPVVSDQQYVEQIEEWSKPPIAPQGDPFRMVLSQDIMKSLNYMRSGARSTATASRPPSEFVFRDNGSGVFNPLEDTSRPIDFPNIMVQGVIVSDGETFATVLVNDSVRYAGVGEALGDDLVIEKISQRGIQVRAAKEHAFIEVSKSYKPNGMANSASQANGRRGNRRSR
jgi:hypothetical protein